MKRMGMLVVLGIVVGCSSDAGKDPKTPVDGGESTQDTGGDGSVGGGDTGVDPTPDVLVADMGAVDLGPVGGDRPADVVVPADWSPDGNYPVLMLLHGYTASSRLQNVYFRTSALVDELQFVLVLPDGLVDDNGQQFWNATDRCCDFNNKNPDDSTYLSELADEVVARYAGDPGRVYLLGHSNGGYMSYRLVCDHADQFAAMASLAGSSWWDATVCQPSEAVGVLQMHGTLDGTVLYDGLTNVYPGAEALVDRWVERNGCAATGADAGSFNYDSRANGDETQVTLWSNCDGGTQVGLWRMVGSGHIPSIDDRFTRAAIDFLFAHTKQ